MALKFSDTDEDSIVAEINITPLTDIFLVLLIIFMISSSAMMEGGLNVKLPSANSRVSTQTQSGKPIFVTLANDGRISVNDKIASENDLQKILQEAIAASSDKTVVIRGDESIVLGKAVKIMDVVRSAGAEKIAIATKPAGGKE